MNIYKIRYDYIRLIFFFAALQVYPINNNVILRVKTDAYYEIIKESNRIRVNVDDYGTYFFNTKWNTIDKVKSSYFYLDKKDSKKLLSMIDSLLFLPINYSLLNTAGFVEVPLTDRSTNKTFSAVNDGYANVKLSGPESAGELVKTVKTPIRIIRLLTELKKKLPAENFCETQPTIINTEIVQNSEFKSMPDVQSFQTDAYFRISNDTVFFNRGAFRGFFKMNEEEYQNALHLLNTCNSIIYCCPYNGVPQEQTYPPFPGKEYVIEGEPNPYIAPDKLMINNITYLRFDTDLSGTMRNKHLIFKFYNMNRELSNYEHFLSYILSLCDKYIIHDPEDRFYQPWLDRNARGRLFYNIHY